ASCCKQVSGQSSSGLKTTAIFWASTAFWRAAIRLPAFWCCRASARSLHACCLLASVGAVALGISNAGPVVAGFVSVALVSCTTGAGFLSSFFSSLATTTGFLSSLAATTGFLSLFLSSLATPGFLLAFLSSLAAAGFLSSLATTVPGALGVPLFFFLALETSISARSFCGRSPISQTLYGPCSLSAL